MQVLIVSWGLPLDISPRQNALMRRGFLASWQISFVFCTLEVVAMWVGTVYRSSPLQQNVLGVSPIKLMNSVKFAMALLAAFVMFFDFKTLVYGAMVSVSILGTGGTFCWSGDMVRVTRCVLLFMYVVFI